MLTVGPVSQHLFLVICLRAHTLFKRPRCGGLPLGAFHSKISGLKLSGTGKVSKIYEYVLSAPSLMEFLQLSKHSRKVSVLISLPSMRSLGQVKKKQYWETKHLQQINARDHEFWEVIGGVLFH